MKGYVFLDSGANINIRDKDYIDTEDPGFWNRNSVTIDTVWLFDTENEQIMHSVLTSFKTKELRIEDVRNFCKAINYDLDAFLKKYSKNKTLE